MSAMRKIREEWKDMQKAADVVRDCYYALKHSGPDAALSVLRGVDAISYLGDDVILRLQETIKEEA